MRVLICSFLLSSCFSLRLPSFGSWQTVGARGKLLCNGKPAAGVHISLYEIDYFYKNLLAVTVTDKNGFFKIWGTDKEITQIDPQLRIYSYCNRQTADAICIDIPSKFISRGKNVHYWDIDIEIGTKANLCSIFEPNNEPTLLTSERKRHMFNMIKT